MEEINNNKINLFNLLLDQISTPIFYKDEQLVYRYCNDAFLKYIDLPREDVINHTAYDIVSEETALTYTQADQEVLSTHKEHNFQGKIINKNGAEFDFIVHKALVRDSNGNPLGIVGIMEDITKELKQMRRAAQIEKIKDFFLEISGSILEKSSLQELFNFIIEKTIMALENARFGCILVLEDNILKIKASVGYHKEDVERFALPLTHSYQWIRTNGQIKKTIIINNIPEYMGMKEGPVFLENLEGKQVKSSISAPIFLDGKLFGFLNIDSPDNRIFNIYDFEIMEYLRKQLMIALTNFKLYENMVYVSEHDSLTGLKNRRFFEDSLIKLIQKSSRYNEEFYIISLDLDGLKKVNDTLGHLAGDELLRYFSNTLKNEIRSSDIISRTGGDEFSLIFLHANEEDIRKKLNNLLIHFNSNPLIFDGHIITCRYSYGVACFPKDGTTLDELIGNADKRMYENKNRVI